MLIPELYSSSLALQPQTAGTALRAWTTGQILQATVVRQALDGTVTLRVGSQEVQARTGLSLAADQPLTLQVAQSGTQTVLRVLHVNNAGPMPHPTVLTQTSGPTPEATLAQAWRQVLPREGDLRPLLAQLAGTPAPAAGGRSEAALPGPVAAALKQFAARLPSLEMLMTPAGLKRAVSDSGLFLEARLAQALTDNSAPAVQNDIKANLLRLVAQLRSLAASPPPALTNPATLPESTVSPTLLHQADAALAPQPSRSRRSARHCCTRRTPRSRASSKISSPRCPAIRMPPPCWRWICRCATAGTPAYWNSASKNRKPG